MSEQPLNLRSRLASLRDALATHLIERDTPVRLVLLAALAGEHLLLLGPPGTAKSALARRVHTAIRDGDFFERLLTKFTVPEELFGPLSIKALEDDRYRRQVDRYLPRASVAFLDEIFKANSAILNSLLTILNEREFDNGTSRDEVPLVTLVGASNERPEGPELNALYDRFLLRYEVSPVSDAAFENLLALRGDDTPQPELSLRLSQKELTSLHKQAARVNVPQEVIALLKALRAFLAGQQIQVSDRRWRKAVFLLQVAAFADGRDEVSTWDGWLLQHCFWEAPEQRAAIFEWYCQRIGAAAPTEPDRFARIVSAQERRLEEDKMWQAQAHDEQGRPLCIGPAGRAVLAKRGQRQKKDSNGEPLYLGRPERSSDRTNKGRGHTLEELVREQFGSYSRSEATKYAADPANHLMEESENAPQMEPMRFSDEHIEGKLRQLDALRAELDAFIGGLERQIAEVQQTVDDHLWIEPGFSVIARRHLQEQLRSAGGLRDRLVALSEGTKNLPRVKS